MARNIREPPRRGLETEDPKPLCKDLCGNFVREPKPLASSMIVEISRKNGQRVAKLWIQVLRYPVGNERALMVPNSTQ